MFSLSDVRHQKHIITSTLKGNTRRSIQFELNAATAGGRCYEESAACTMHHHALRSSTAFSGDQIACGIFGVQGSGEVPMHQKSPTSLGSGLILRWFQGRFCSPRKVTADQLKADAFTLQHLQDRKGDMSHEPSQLRLSNSFKRLCGLPSSDVR